MRIDQAMAEPPPPIASLSEEDQRALRDILQRAVEGISAEEAAAALTSAKEARPQRQGAELTSAPPAAPC